ncbi:hypothetical protein [Methylobacterium sp. J-076]|uniref:hypothetical protein n=1 Tax=Methylobacterium sp. J-076 TaxID=2836655 RepID=UPI001FBA4C40|nr:hypothetical protein [Methylobacterium sp. J-076]MCJ2012591.1 hypothetical protein [Methylobacterium sp. J-076]
MPTRPAHTLCLAAALVAAVGAAQARPSPRHRPGAVSTDSDRVLTRMAARDAETLWPAWRHRRSLAATLPPATREEVAAPPFTGWGYGASIPGAWPSFR